MWKIVGMVLTEADWISCSKSSSNSTFCTIYPRGSERITVSTVADLIIEKALFLVILSYKYFTLLLASSSSDIKHHYIFNTF
jgi:hypothetical protein